MESEGEIMVLGKSVLVPSVKELTETSLTTTVPNRYIRPDQYPPFSSSADNNNNNDGCSDLQVPIINMEGLISGDLTELQKLHLACKDWGFFQLINHGVSPSMLESFKVETVKFFSLKMEEKKKYWQTPSDIEGFGQLFVFSEDQKLDWADMFYLTTLPKSERRAHLLPMLPIPYSDLFDRYSMEIQNLAMKILDCIAKALGIETDAMRGVYGSTEGKQSIRLNYYPPCPKPDKVIGLTPHSDAVSMVTILLQLNEVVGLQVNKDGKWVSIKPHPDAFIVNVGDLLEIATNGVYQSVIHRAVVNATKERYSVASFQYPGNDEEVGPIPSLITPDNPAKFRRMNMAEYIKGFFARTLDSKAYIETMRINSSN